MDTPTALSDDVLLDRFQRAAFDYFLQYSDATTGLVADSSREGSPCSIAVAGFALSCYPIGAERGWMTRDEAASRTLTMLRFFWNARQSPEPDATGYKGFYYHFLDMRSGKRAWHCELSLIDTALLLAGVLTASMYFTGQTGNESEIRQLADAIYRRVDWQWAKDGLPTISQGWKPECGFLHYGWEGYNEATILYILSLASPTFPLDNSSYAHWTASYQWENIYDVELLYSGPLFTHLFSHAWIDFRGIQDDFMREKSCDYFENSRRAVIVQREYAVRNPHSFKAYGAHCWGISAGDGPGNEELREDEIDRRFFGYMARGAPFGPDDGTLCPWAMLAALPFAPRTALAGARHLLENYPAVCAGDRYSSGFNPTLAENGGWISEGYLGLDQGIIVMMIENHRTDFIWRLMRSCPAIRTGLTLAGFKGGWL